MTAPRRPLRADAQRNYNRLLEQAAADFAAYGAQASLEDIARSAGVGSATLYRHFPSRDALLAEVIRSSLDSLHDEAQQLLSASNADKALRTWFRAAVAHAATYRGLSTSLMSAFYDEGSQLHASCSAMHTAGGLLLARAQELGTARRELTAKELFILINALAWAVEWNKEDGSIAQHLIDMMFSGILTAD